MSFIFEPEGRPAVAIANSEELFPVHRIYCVGRNYADHAIEMGFDPDREPPFFFSKPADALVNNHAEVSYPTLTDNLHHEIELVVAVGKKASKITVEEAASCIFGYAVGNDLTRRDLQSAAKQAGLPWDVAKGFDQSAPISAIVSIDDCGERLSGEISLKVNGEQRQRGDLAQMVWSVNEVIAELSQYYTLKAGDLIFTGTPAGVGKIVAGDEIEAYIEGLGTLKNRIV